VTDEERIVQAFERDKAEGGRTHLTRALREVNGVEPDLYLVNQLFEELDVPDEVAASRHRKAHAVQLIRETGFTPSPPERKHPKDR
jgi:hypothetical protein